MFFKELDEHHHLGHVDAAFRMHNPENQDAHDHIFLFLVQSSYASSYHKGQDIFYWSQILCTIVYYFQDDHVFSYYNHTLETGYPKTIQEDFPGVPTHLDAAVECPQGECVTDSVLFFKGMLAFTAAKLFSKSKWILWQHFVEYCDIMRLQ